METIDLDSVHWIHYTASDGSVIHYEISHYPSGRPGSRVASGFLEGVEDSSEVIPALRRIGRETLRIGHETLRAQ